MKEFHIISSGVSILTNAQRVGILPQDKRVADEDYWGMLLQNPTEINKLKEFVKLDPYKNSAELNTFLRVVKDKNPEEIEVYLFGAKTSSNELCRRVIESYLKELSFRLYTPIEVSGYFWKAKYYNEKIALDEFKKGISELLDRLIYLARKKIEEGYEVYYMNEEFDQVVFLPPLFYLPKGNELEILKKLSSTTFVSGKNAENLFNENTNEIERLSLYGLVSFDFDESDKNKIYRIIITNKGKFLIEKLKESGI